MTNLLDRIFDYANDEVTADVNNSTTQTDSFTNTNAGARVTLDTAQTISDETTTKVEFDTVAFDDWGGWDSTNNEYDIQEDGVYVVEITLSPIQPDVSDGDKGAAKGRINASDVFEGVNTTGGALQFSIQVLGVVDLVSGDTLDAAIFYNSTADTSVDLVGNPRHNHMSIAKVG